MKPIADSSKHGSTVGRGERSEPRHRQTGYPVPLKKRRAPLGAKIYPCCPRESSPAGKSRPCAEAHQSTSHNQRRRMTTPEPAPDLIRGRKTALSAWQLFQYPDDLPPPASFVSALVNRGQRRSVTLFPGNGDFPPTAWSVSKKSSRTVASRLVPLISSEA